ncbi:hypothetical protein FB451DRAFT_1465271 [Mycena latifolia]|nr:hypothetical protein FB451DRAFT_1465271 [Mycena latifolia]
MGVMTPRKKLMMRTMPPYLALVVVVRLAPPAPHGSLALMTLCPAVTTTQSASPAPEMPFPSKRKHPATATPHYQKKQPRLSGGARALENIATSAADFNEFFAGVGNGLTAAVAAATVAPAAPAGASAPIAPPTAQPAFQTTPHRKQDAIKRARRLEKWLGLDKLVMFVELLRQDVSLVDTYNALEDDDVQVGWVKDQVNKNTAFDLNAYDFSSM